MRDTIELAREAGADTLMYWDIEKLKRFEALVRADERNRTWTQEHWTDYERSIEAAEREACAKVCDAFQARGVGMQPAECAGAIRARGNT